ncbi:hypothetical protein WN943_019734 [Citrus x changshan-huyou]
MERVSRGQKPRGLLSDKYSVTYDKVLLKQNAPCVTYADEKDQRIDAKKHTFSAFNFYVGEQCSRSEGLGPFESMQMLTSSRNL